MAKALIQQMIQAYAEDIVQPPGHLSSMFTVPRGGIHNAREINWHVRRNTEKIAIPMRTDKTGYHLNARMPYTAKKVPPPVYKEAYAIAATDLGDFQQYGKDPFADFNFQQAASEEAATSAANLEAIISRAVELQASQILTTGKLDITDEDDEDAFVLDFKPKSTHFVDAATAWDTVATTVPLTDIENLCDVIRTDGKRDPVRIHMGMGSYNAFKNATTVKAALSTQIDIYNGALVPMRIAGGTGAKYRGVLEVGNYRLDIFTYDGRYDHPNTGTSTKFLPDDKVIIESAGRLDATFGAINNFGTDGRANRFWPRRMTNRTNLSDLSMNLWISPDGEILNIGVGSRPLLIPTAIDTFGCIDTGI